MNQPQPRWHSGTWWAGVSGIAAILGLLVALVAWLHPFPSGDSHGNSSLGSPQTNVDGLARTPDLGLEIYQDNERVSLQPESNHTKATLSSHRFEIRFAALQKDQGIHICVWKDDSIFQMSNLFDGGQCFGYGSGVADTDAGSENLYVEQDGHNYLVGNRIALGGNGFQTIYVANLVDGPDVPPRSKPWGRVYLTFLEDNGPNDDPLNTSGRPQVDANQLDFLELDFT